eukprot:1591528-Pyramimonas_sp.AAC.1
MMPEAQTRMPALLAFDYGQAFPSVSQHWIFLMLRTLSLPPPLYAFLETIYSEVSCWGQIGSTVIFRFMIESGIIQGCPASGALYAVASHAFAAHFEWLIEKRGHGLARLCADGVGS